MTGTDPVKGPNLDAWETCWRSDLPTDQDPTRAETYRFPIREDNEAVGWQVLAARAS